MVTDYFQIVTVLLLIIISAYFVMAEFALVKVRKTRMEQLASEGNKQANKVLLILANLDGYLSACQIGITITSLGLGWLGEPAVQSLLDPFLQRFNLGENVTHSISFLIAFLLITYIHVVFGELAPKTIAIQKAETISLKISSSIIFFYKLMYPFIWLLNGTANVMVRLFGFEAASEHSDDHHSEEEIKLIVSSSNDINNDEKEMVERIFTFDETIAREIMVHRKEMQCVYLKDSYDEILRSVKDNRYSRFPVIGKDKDDIKGYINLRDLLSEDKETSIESFIRDIPKVYESTPIKTVLALLQKQKSPIAVVLDEYGGVSGILTLEDILEELVGQIQDEYDNEVQTKIRKGKKRWIIEGDVHIEEVEDAIGHTFNNKDNVVSIGGFLMTHLGGMDFEREKKYEIDGKLFEILDFEDNRITVLAIEK